MLLPSKIIGENFYANGGFFSGTLTTLNTDTTFSEITTGDSHEISSITSGAVVTFAGGAEIVTGGDCSSDSMDISDAEWVYSVGDEDYDIDGSQVTGKNCGQAITGLDISKTYKCVVNVKAISGQARLYLGGNYSAFLTTGVQTFFLSPDSTNVDFNVRANSGCSATVDDFSLKEWNDYTAGDVISIGGVESEALGAEIATNGAFVNWTGLYPDDFTHSTNDANSEILEVGPTEGRGGVGTGACNIWTDDNTYTWIGFPVIAGVYYKLTLDITNSVTGDIKGGTTVGRNDVFVDISAVDSYEYTFIATTPEFRIARSQSTCDITVDNISVKLIPEVLAKPYRIDSIDSDGVCTLLNADFSDLAASITSGYATSAVPANYSISNGGWMQGLDLDPTPVNTNSEFDQWSYGASTITNDDNESEVMGISSVFAGTLVQSNDQAKTGTYSAKYTADSNDTIHSARETLVPGHFYNVTGSVYIPSAQTISGVTFQYYDGSDYIDIETTTTTDAWVDFDYSFVGSYLRIKTDVNDCDGDVFYLDNLAPTEVTPDNFTVSGLSATNYLVYDTTLNTIRFVSDGNETLQIRSETVVDETSYFYEVGITNNTSGRLKFGPVSDNFMASGEDGHIQGFTEASSIYIALTRYATCDVTVSYFRLYATDTYVVCDGSQLSSTDLESTEATILNTKGYKTTIELDSIDGGTLTPVISTKEGLPIDTASTDEQNIKASGTDTAKIRASVAVNSAKVTNFTVEQYN